MRGPLNIARPVQGWPVIVQAGASEDGRQLAAETAEAVFTGGGSLADGQKLYADIKGRMDKLGRDREHLKILPGAFVVVGDSVEEAKEKRALLDSRVHYDSAIASLSVRSAPTPPVRSRRAAAADPGNQCQQERPPADGRCRRARQTDGAPARAARRWLWRAVLCRHAENHRRPDGGVADEHGSDGFNIMFPYLPAGLDDFVDKVVPELQRRGMFRTEYEGTTLRENLGLPRPKNRFFEKVDSGPFYAFSSGSVPT